MCNIPSVTIFILFRSLLWHHHSSELIFNLYPHLDVDSYLIVRCTIHNQRTIISLPHHKFFWLLQILVQCCLWHLITLLNHTPRFPTQSFFYPICRYFRYSTCHREYCGYRTIYYSLWFSNFSEKHFKN